MKLSRRSFTNLALGAIGSAAVGRGLGEQASSVPDNAAATAKAPAQEFYWGVSTAAYQTEGGNTNTDLWLLEHAPTGMFREKSGDACDHYHLYPEDIQLIRSLGFNSYRFSIEWARVEPEEGEFSLAQLNHYRRVAEACRASGLAPMITLHHFSSPLWFSRSGGWEREDAGQLFARYCARVGAHLGHLAAAACTINEINIPAIIQRRHYFTDQARAHFRSAVSAWIPAEKFSTFLTADPETVQKKLIDAHVLAREAFKQACPNVPVGINLAIADDQAVDGGEAKLREYQALCYDGYLDVARKDDFVALQTYTRNLVGPEGDRKPAPEVRKTQMGWEYYPESLEHTLRYASARCNRPIIVTENGIATEKDEERIEYIRTAVEGMLRCIKDGIDVRGYYHWSAMDNYEWTEGYRPKFGLISVDRTNFARTVKPSAHFLGEIARTGKLAETNSLGSSS